jgi:alkylhydroperoxidase family enzyme
MFLVKTVDPAEATGSVAEVYAAFKQAGSVPLPMELLSASPGLQKLQFGVMGHFISHAKLSPPLLASIRFAASGLSCHDACLDFNGKLLRRMGMGKADLEALSQGRAPESLDEREAALALFVRKALSQPAAVTAADVDALRAQDWADSDIFDAVYHGASLMASAALQKAFVR